MVKTCIGYKHLPGCGQTKMEHEFSLSYKGLCKECDNKHRRNKYHKIEHVDPKEQELIKLSTSTPWR